MNVIVIKWRFNVNAPFFWSLCLILIGTTLCNLMFHVHRSTWATDLTHEWLGVDWTESPKISFMLYNRGSNLTLSSLPETFEGRKNFWVGWYILILGPSCQKRSVCQLPTLTIMWQSSNSSSWMVWYLISLSDILDSTLSNGERACQWWSLAL